MTELIKQEEKKVLSVLDLKTQIDLIQATMSKVMKKNVHFGEIPGCKKPSLWKPGAEKLLALFRIAVTPEVFDLATEDCIRYRVKISGNYIPDNTYLGAAFGECSSNEEKYKWRASVCNEEYENTQGNKKRYKYKKDLKGVVSIIAQIRTEPADIANTVLKMAYKRAMVAFCLNATAASDVFDQDTEDLDKNKDKNKDKGSNGNGMPKATAANCISDAQAKRFFAIAMGAKKTKEDIDKYLKEIFGINSSKEIKREWYEDAIAWAESKGE